MQDYELTNTAPEVILQNNNAGRMLTMYFVDELGNQTVTGAIENGATVELWVKIGDILSPIFASKTTYISYPNLGSDVFGLSANSSIIVAKLNGTLLNDNSKIIIHISK